MAMIRTMTLVCVLMMVPVATAEPIAIYPSAKHGKGELRYINQLPVAILEGTPEEIGEQYGKLVLAPAATLMKSVPEFIKAMGLAEKYPELIKLGQTLLDHTEPDFRTEMAAVAKGAGIDLEVLVFSNTMADIYKLGGCSTVVVEPSRSMTGNPIFGRNFDWPPFKNLGDHTLIVVFKPKGKHAFVSVNMPSVMGIISGMNDAGLCITMNEIKKSADKAPTLDPDGVPLAYLYRRILEECTTIDEAEVLMRKMKRSTAAAITLCDRKGGAVFEITPKTVKVRRSVEGVCCCTNHFRCEGLSLTKECRRYSVLEKLQQPDAAKMGVPEVTKELNKVSQFIWTMQVMVFEPEELNLYLAFGSGMSSKKPLPKVELKELFGK